MLQCTLVAIHKNELEEAQTQVQKAREKLDNQVTGLLLESYERAQDKILKLQQLTEMEEIIELKQFEKKKSLNENNGEFSYLKMNELLE